MEGAIQGLNELYEERFDSEGKLVQNCESSDGTTLWGADNCDPVIESYKASMGTTCSGTDECNANIACTAGNDPAGAAYTTADQCDLVSLKYGLSQW